MGMPLDFFGVRHAESEANVLYHAEKAGYEISTEQRMRHDSLHRLSSKGVEQARIAGLWIKENIGDLRRTFDACYVSHFMRARETAAHLGGKNLSWRVHSMLYERDWGHFGSIPINERPLVYPRTHRLQEDAPLFARLEGGESLAGDVTLRVRDFLDEVKNKWSGRRVLVVTHGEVMKIFRSELEDMSPETWQAVDKDKSQELENCAILWYTRANPDNPNDIRPYLGWRRIIQPNDLANSPFGGEWQKLPDKTYMSGAELLESVEKIPHLLKDDS